MNTSKILFFATLLFTTIGLPQRGVAQYNIGAVFSASATIVDDDEPALPLNWLSLSANLVVKQTQLNWTVANEQNISSYRLEWSIDLANWLTIGEVAAQNKREQTYEFYHRSPRSGDNFYRIHSVETDGRKNYSKVVTLSVATDEIGAVQLRVYPNPATDAIKVVLPTEFAVQKTTQIEIYDLNGKLVWQQQYQPSTALSLQELPSGTYQIVARQGQLRVQTGIIKTKR